mgnify:FL=1
MYKSTVWCHMMAEMPATFLARELLAAYHTLENLYWKRIFIWLPARVSKKFRAIERDTKLRIIEGKVNIKFYGGEVPKFF